MGRQSSRILINGQDAKQVIACDESGKAYDIDQIWMSDKANLLQLAWKKLKALGVTWEVAVGEVTPRALVVRNNGSVLCLIDDITHNIFTSSDGKEWNAITNPFGSYYLLSESLNADENGFIATKTYRNDGTLYYQPAISNNGNLWEPVNEIILYYENGNYIQYTTDGSTDYKLLSEQNDRKNGRYVVLNGQGSGQYINAVSEVNIETADGSYSGSKVIGLQYINGYYYFFSTTNSTRTGLWRTADFESFEMLLLLPSSVLDYTAIITEYAEEIYVIYSSSGTNVVSYKSSDGINFVEYDFLYYGREYNWLDYISGNNDILVHAYTDRIFVNDTEYLISDMYDESLSLYFPHVNIMGNKIYVTYTDRYGESPIVTFIGTVEG